MLSVLGVMHPSTSAAFAVHPGKEVDGPSLERKVKKSKYNASHTNKLVLGKKGNTKCLIPTL